MLRSPHGLHRPLSLLVLGAVLAAAAVAAAGEFEREFTLEGDRLEVWDLIGAVELEPGRGDDFQVLVRVRGEDADEDLIGFAVDEGRTARLVIEFPLDEHRRYVYPELGRGSSTTMSADDWGRGRDSGWLAGLFGKKIRISGRGSGLELWCDVTIRVPEGKAAAVRTGAGRIDAAGVRGDLDLDTASGPVTARDQEGDLLIDTGSGSVEVLGAEATWTSTPAAAT